MKMSKIAAIVAAAALLVIGAAFTSMAATYDWQLENGEWVCYDKDGYQYYDTWAQSASGDWYYLGDEGVMATNQKLQWKSTSKYVYVGADGSIQKDAWVKIDNDDEDNTYDWYRFGSNGYMVVNKKAVIDGKTYFFNAEGKMLTGWVAVTTGSEYYAAANKNVDGIYYCAGKEDGSAVIGDWKKIDIKANDDDDPKETWFYFQSSGRMFKAADGTGLATKKINGNVYAFNEDGEMQSKWLANATAGIATYSYFSDPEVGARVSKGWFQAYAQNETQERIDDGEATLNWYYAQSAGSLAKSQIKKINGKYYCFDATGKMQSGLVWVTPASGSQAFAVESATSELTADNFETTIKNDTTGRFLYYFSGDAEKDGSMKFSTQKVTVDDEDFTLYFNNASTSARGQALNTKTVKGIYFNGVKVAASSEARYVFLQAEIDADGSTVKNIVGEPKYAYQLVGKDRPGYIVLNSAGRVLTSLNSKDGDGYTVKYSDGKLTIEE